MNNQKIDINFKAFKENGFDMQTYQINDMQPLYKGVYEKIDELILKNMPDDIFYDLMHKIQKESARRNNERN
jgi:hypothetical protein